MTRKSRGPRTGGRGLSARGRKGVCQGPGEAIPRRRGARVWRASVQAPPGSGLETRHGGAPRPLRAGGGAGVIRGQRLGFYHKVAWAVLRKLPHRWRKAAKRPCPLRGKELRGPDDASQDRGYGISLAARPLCSRTGALGAAATHAPPPARAPWGSAEAPRWRGAGGSGAALWTRESAQRSDSPLKHSE